MNYKKITSFLMALALSTSISVSAFAIDNNGFPSSKSYYDAVKTQTIVMENGELPDRIRTYTEIATPEYVVVDLIADSHLKMEIFPNNQIGFYHQRNGNMINKWSLVNDIGAKYYIDPFTEYVTSSEYKLFRTIQENKEIDLLDGKPHLTQARFKEDETLLRVAIPISHPLVAGTLVQKNTYRVKISDGNVQKNGSSSYEVERSYGWSDSQVKQITKTTGLNISLGANIGQKDASGGSAGVTLSREISEMFSSSTTYQSSQTTKKREVINGNGETTSEVAFYQEFHEYKVLPSKALQEALKKPYLLTEPRGGYTGSTKGHFRLALSKPVEIGVESVKSVVVDPDDTSFSKYLIR